MRGEERLSHEAHVLLYKLDVELERYEDDGQRADARLPKLYRLLQQAEKRLYRRSNVVARNTFRLVGVASAEKAQAAF